MNLILIRSHFLGVLRPLFFVGLIATSSLLLSFTVSARGIPQRPLALVYNGAGACPESCAESLAVLANQVGFAVRYISAITPETEPFLAQAQVWIQPGGDAIDAARAMGAYGLQRLRAFVNNGGHYVGFCAGVFLADHTVDDGNQIQGLGLFPGTTVDHLPLYPFPTLVRLGFASGLKRDVYFEGGPEFRNLDQTKVRVLAVFENGAPAMTASQYGLGKVVLSGPHPEAPASWVKAAFLNDQDGPDQDIALSLIKMVY